MSQILKILVLKCYNIEANEMLKYGFLFISILYDLKNYAVYISIIIQKL